MHGRATRTRAWCGHVHAHGKDMHVRVATNRAGILLAIMRPGQLKTKEAGKEKEIEQEPMVLERSGEHDCQ